MPGPSTSYRLTCKLVRHLRAGCAWYLQKGKREGDRCNRLAECYRVNGGIFEFEIHLCPAHREALQRTKGVNCHVSNP